MAQTLPVRKREFTLAEEYPYNRTNPVRWVLSHLWRYPWLPLAAIAAATLNNFFYSFIQILIGLGFDVITTPDWTVQALGVLALGVAASAIGQGLTGLTRNYSIEILAQRIERDTRDELPNSPRHMTFRTPLDDD